MIAQKKVVHSDLSRRREIGLIHLAKATLGLTRDDYEHVLRTVTGKSSAADLDAAGREKLLKHFKSRGFVVKAKPGTGRSTFMREPQVKKLVAMWYALAERGAVARPIHALACSQAVEKWAKEQLVGTQLGPLDALRFANGAQLQKLIEQMKQWGQRVGADVS